MSILDLPPPILYSYSPGGAWLPACLAGKSLLFSSRQGFNDPFDSRPGYLIDQGTAGINWIKNTVYGMKGLSPAEKLIRLQKFKRQSQNPSLLEDFVAERMLNEIGILCLTEQWDEPLFWGHYAAKHSGICIGFHTDKDVFRLAEKITYQDEMPIIVRPHDDVEVMLQKAFLTKSTCWKNEKEWRLLKTNSSSRANLSPHMDSDERMLCDQRGPGVYQFDAEAIESVTMGMSISPSMEDFVRKTVRDIDRNIPLFKGSRHPRQYKIERKSVRP